MTVSMLLHSTISIRDNVSLGTFHKTLIQQRGSMSDGPNCQPLVSSVSLKVWNVRSLWSNHLHKKPAALSVWLTQPLHWVGAVTTGQAPIDHPAHRSGSSKTTRSRDLEHWWHLSTVHWRPSMQTTWSPAQSLIRYLLNVFWAELNIFF